MFLGGGERVHWELMGEYFILLELLRGLPNILQED